MRACCGAAELPFQSHHNSTFGKNKKAQLFFKSWAFHENTIS